MGIEKKGLSTYLRIHKLDPAACPASAIRNIAGYRALSIETSILNLSENKIYSVIMVVEDFTLPNRVYVSKYADIL